MAKVRVEIDEEDASLVWLCLLERTSEEIASAQAASKAARRRRKELVQRAATAGVDRKQIATAARLTKGRISQLLSEE